MITTCKIISASVPGNVLLWVAGRLLATRSHHQPFASTFPENKQSKHFPEKLFFTSVLFIINRIRCISYLGSSSPLSLPFSCDVIGAANTRKDRKHTHLNLYQPLQDLTLHGRRNKNPVDTLAIVIPTRHQPRYIIPIHFTSEH